jgi:hypothetical protein
VRRGVRWWPFAVLAVPIGWNAWWMRAELGSVSYVNDNAFHQAVLRWMHGRLESGDHSLDGWFPGVNLAARSHTTIKRRRIALPPTSPRSRVRTA